MGVLGSALLLWLVGLRRNAAQDDTFEAAQFASIWPVEPRPVDNKVAHTFISVASNRIAEHFNRAKPTLKVRSCNHDTPQRGRITPELGAYLIEPSHLLAHNPHSLYSPQRLFAGSVASRDPALPICR